MAAPTFVAEAHTVTSGGTEPTQTTSTALPSGWQKDDIFILVHVSGNVDQPDGWHQFTDRGFQTGSSGGHVWWRRATASETDPVVTTRGSTNEREVVIVAIRGCPTFGNPFDTVASGTQASSTTATFPAITTTVADCLIVNIITSGLDNVTGGRVSAYANANLTSVTERVDQYSSTGGGVGCWVGTGVKATAGSVGSSTATQPSDTPGLWTIAMKSAATPDPTFYTGPTFVGRGTSTSTAVAATLTPGLPSGWAENDILFILVAREGGSDPSAPSGYSSVTGSPAGGYSLFWKRATSSESAPSVVYGGVTPNICVAQMFAVRGCNTSGNPWSDISTWDDDSVNDTTQTAPAITPSFNQSLVLHVIFNGLDNISGQRVCRPSNTDLSDMREFVDTWTATGNGAGFAVFGGSKLSAAAVGAGTITSSDAATNKGVTLALPSDVGAAAGSVGGFQATWIG